MNTIKVGILTVSDRCSSGLTDDESGKNLLQILNKGHLFKSEVSQRKIVPDSCDEIQAALKNWSDDLKLAVILTTGGTGIAPRDVTPEATKSVIDRELPGMSLAMLKGSLEITPMAMLSRAVCGVRGKTLIINLPGSKKGSQECLQFVSPVIPHAVDLIHDNKNQVNKTHVEVQFAGGDHHACTHHIEDPSPSEENPVLIHEDELNKDCLPSDQPCEIIIMEAQLDQNIIMKDGDFTVVLSPGADDGNAWESNENESFVAKRPKKAKTVTGYNVFFQRKKAEMTTSHKKSFGELAKEIGRHWKLLSPTEKQIYHQEARQQQSQIESCKTGNGKNILCTGCNKTFTHHRYFKTHLSECGHSFDCDQCGKTFANSNGLRKHRLYVHQNVRSFQCVVCSKYYKSRTDLTQHCRTHTKERPYKCDACNLDFNVKSNYSRHMRKKHSS